MVAVTGQRFDELWLTEIGILQPAFYFGLIDSFESKQFWIYICICLEDRYLESICPVF